MTMTPLDGYSEDNLRKFSKIISIITNQIELGWDRLAGVVRIPFATLERRGVNYEEVRIIIGAINETMGEMQFIEIINDEPYEKVKTGLDFDFDLDLSKEQMLESWLFINGGSLNVSEDDLKNKLILRLLIEAKQNPLETLNNLKGHIDKKLATIKSPHGRPKIIEIHYSQKGIFICYGKEEYKPRGTKYITTIRDIAQHFGSEDKLINEKPFRPGFSSINEKDELNKLKNETLHNINRQLKDKQIPMSFELNGECILVKSEVEIQYI